jgi:hypothetical protein
MTPPSAEKTHREFQLKQIMVNWRSRKCTAVESWLNWGNRYQISCLVSDAKDKFQPKNRDTNDVRSQKVTSETRENSLGSICAGANLLPNFVGSFAGIVDPPRTMSALPRKADIGAQSKNVGFVPDSDIALECAQLKFLNIVFSLGTTAGPSSASKEYWRWGASSSRAAGGWQ